MERLRAVGQWCPKSSEKTRGGRVQIKGIEWTIVCAIVVAAGSASAQPYPAKPLRFIVPQAAGGQNDTHARLVADRLATALGLPVVVENRPGAGGRVGFEAALRLPADAHTLVLGSAATLATIPAAHRKPPYDTSRFTPVTLMATSPYVLVVHPSVPVRSAKELVALAKVKPAALSYGTSGNATGLHLTTEMFAVGTGIRMTHVPYKGVAPATISIVSGEVDVMFNNVIPAVPHLQNGRLRALGVTADARNRQLPQVPTMAEAGYPGMQSASWQGVVIAHPAPPAAVDRLQREIVAILKSDEVRATLEGLGNDIVGSTPAQFADYIRAEQVRWKKVIDAAGLVLVD